MGLAALVLAGALAASAPDAQLDRVQVQGEAAIAREKKTLAQLWKAQSLFEKYHALAPAAALTFKLYPRTQAEAEHTLSLALVTPEGREPVARDADDRFVIDPAWQRLAPATELRSRLADGRVTWRPDIRTPGVPQGERRLGDLRLQCRVAFGSGVARGSTGIGALLSFMFDDCEDKDWSPSNFADQPVFAVTLVHGQRRVTISQLMLHGLRDEGGPDYDWGYSLRERMFRLPLGDESWPDDTRIVFESMDDPPAPPDGEVKALQEEWVQAALALAPGLTAGEVAQRLGPFDDDTRFESGRRLQRRLHVSPTAAGKLRVEQVSLFDAQDRLMKTSLRPLAASRRD